ncbi:hypothetical protein JRQ81_003825 [Phrynocephalus forsythii]|uniref:Uncharacterized protein n=1 Tax=Phrynocephalus forsythii TaxID=171643 RepID=A0A9Q0XMT4_9SAUR|nr:hypothetical protein JRQ81_003825 [Phrynocephalus forsythii]
MRVQEASEPRPRTQSVPVRGRLLSARVLKAKPAIIIVIGVMGLGLGGGLFCLLRYAIYSPELSWNRKDSETSDEHTPKFLGLTEDYSTLKRNR